MSTRRTFLKSSAAAAGALATGVWPARAGNAPGITGTEIKIGQTMPYSGPASAYGVIGKTEAAYFKMINEQGGVNGRKINLVSLDDGYSPPKTVEQTRKLVEEEQVSFILNGLGTAPMLAVREYLNQNKVPQLFVATGAAAFGDYQHFPWTMGYQPNYQTEANIFGKHIAATKAGGKVAILYQNDGFGKDYVTGLKAGLGADKAGMVISEVSYENAEPTVDSQIVTLQASGADIFVIAATPKYAAQAIRKAFDIGWTPTRYVTDVSVSIAAVLKPAGLDKSKGLITAAYAKDATDAIWKDDPGLKAFADFVAKYGSANDIKDTNAAYGFNMGVLTVEVLKRCGADLSRENIMKQATSIKDLELPMLLPGVRINTAPDNYYPIRTMQLAQFDGENWKNFGELITA